MPRLSALDNCSVCADIMCPSEIIYRDDVDIIILDWAGRGVSATTNDDG